MFNAKTFAKFISTEDCAYLIKIANESNAWTTGGTSFWDNRVISYSTIKSVDTKAANIMLDANFKCKNVIEKSYSLNKDVYADTLVLVRWFEGMSQPPHADDMSNTDIEGFKHRVFGSIIYLNTDYTGGHTYYPNFNVEVIPETGTLAIHPGDPEHLHGVTEIKNGTRYTLASFWTFEKEKNIHVG